MELSLLLFGICLMLSIFSLFLTEYMRRRHNEKYRTRLNFKSYINVTRDGNIAGALFAVFTALAVICLMSLMVTLVIH